MKAETVSVIICTRNRAESLASTLASVACCTLPSGWIGELLVVDNGSTDDTRYVVDSAPRGPLGLRRVVEPAVGLSHARNRGLREASGDIIMFTDDDVRVAPSWVSAMCMPMVQGEADAVQGMVLPAPELRRPWLKGIYADAMAIVEPGRAGSPQSLVGANMAFRRSVLKAVPCFETELGAGAAGFGEDTLFGIMIHRAGYRMVYAHDAVVEHHFEPGRLAATSFLQWAARASRASALMDVKWLNRGLRRRPRVRVLWIRAKCALRSVPGRGNGPVPPEWYLWYQWHINYAMACAEITESR